MINIDLLEKSELLVGRRVILTFADGVREDWVLESVDPAERSLSVYRYLYPGSREAHAAASYEIDGTANRSYNGAEDVPAIVGIEVF